MIYFCLKRIIDIIGSLFLLLLFSPIFITVSIIIKFTSPGPVFFSQERVGRNGIFRMYKFRSMYIGDNDKRLRENYPKLWEKYKKLDWKLPMDEDPRITPVGKIIRSLTIDEFPQFFNVLKGDMSLVGPRAYRDPELKEYAKKYPQTRQYIKNIRSIKPGITGPWQVSGRNELSFEQRSKLDSDYAEKKSIIYDIGILLKTPKAMLSSW